MATPPTSDSRPPSHGPASHGPPSHGPGSHGPGKPSAKVPVAGQPGSRGDSQTPSTVVDAPAGKLQRWDVAHADRLESLASMLERFGPPPDDLARHLTQRFRTAVANQLRRGQPLPTLDLNRWYVTDEGDLDFVPPQDHAVGEQAEKTPADRAVAREGVRSTDARDTPPGDARASQRRVNPKRLTRSQRRKNASKNASKRPPTSASHADAEIGATEEVNQLTAQFQRLLTSPMPFRPSRRKEPPARLSQQLARPLETHLVEETETSQFSSAEKARREALVDLFTQALVDRFGEDQVQAQPDPGLAARELKLKPIERDRKFNWNRLLGVATATIALALVVAGYQLVERRRQRVADAPRPEPAAPDRTTDQANPVGPVGSIGEKPAASIGEKNGQSRPEAVNATGVADAVSAGRPGDDAVPADPAQTGATRNRPRPSDFASSDPLDQLQSLVEGEAADQRVDVSEQIDVRLDTSEILPLTPSSQVDIDLRSGKFELKTTDKPADEPVEAGAGDPGTTVAPSPQDDSSPANSADAAKPAARSTAARSTAAGSTAVHAVTLPPPTDSETKTTLAEEELSFTGIEFPTGRPITLTAGASKGMAGLFREGNEERMLAVLRSTPDQTAFSWTDQARKESASALVPHGRLRLDDSTRLYLRPALEAAPAPLSLNPATWSGTWDLQAPILESVTRMQLDLQVPERLEVEWITPFDTTRVGSSQAVARLTPEDDLPVAIFLQIRVKCGRQLELQLSYEAQLGPEFARLPVSRRGINATWEASQSQLRIGKQALKRIDQLYDVGDAINRKLNRRMLREKREHLENRVAMLEPYVQRLEMLEILATKLDASGKLHFELFVDWPDESRQPLLRTVGGDDNERRSADAG